MRVPNGVTKGKAKFKVSYVGWKETVAPGHLEVPIQRLLEEGPGQLVIPTVDEVP